MKSKTGTTIFAALMAAMIFSVCAAAQDLKPIKLPAPDMKGGMPLMEALKARSTSRDFSDKKLTQQQLSNLLWAAFGINRPELGKRTAPSAVNWQEIEIYVALQEGLFTYDAKNNELAPVLANDVRAATGIQAYAAQAPVSLVYVADFSKMGTATKEDRILYSAADTGFISQNVYLYCASEGLSTFVRGLVDKAALAKILNLRKEQKIVLAQSVGYPK
ncbi:MAG: SagB/ThcOx family dehydrogenase [bacterium]